MDFDHSQSSNCLERGLSRGLTTAGAVSLRVLQYQLAPSTDCGTAFRTRSLCWIQMAAATGTGNHADQLLADKKGADGPCTLTGLNCQRPVTRWTSFICWLDSAAAETADVWKERIAIRAHLGAGHQVETT